MAFEAKKKKKKLNMCPSPTYNLQPPFLNIPHVAIENTFFGPQSKLICLQH